jgi:O-antigen ligase
MLHVPTARVPAAGAAVLLPWIGGVLLLVALVPVLAGGRAAHVLGLVLGGVLAAAVIVQPALGVLLVFGGWFIRIPLLSYGVSILLLVPLVALIVADRRVRAVAVTPIKVLLGIGGLFLVSVWWNEWVHTVPALAGADDTGAQLTIFAVRLGFIVFCFYFVTTVRRVSWLAWLVVALVVAAALSALPAFSTGLGFKRAHALFGLAGNANRLAHLCLVVTALVWCYRMHGRDRRLRALTLPLLFVMPFVALATASRSGLLQLGLLAALVIREQTGWSAAKRARSFMFLGALGLVVAAAAPAAQLIRATTFDRAKVAKGQDSLNNRLNTVVAAVEIVASDPVFGVGIGNFRSVKRTREGLPRSEGTHNAYLWALTSGGVGALALYLTLFYSTYRTLRRLEAGGPPELLWLAKGMRMSLLLFLLFSVVADFWLSEIFAVMVALPLAMARAAERRAAPTSTPTPWTPVTAMVR